ncbi:MAG TPA: HEAT repeat domain-containing protein [Pyrinomonadaceae bacterium]|nr:HEAT repeat domain-containing protein [Pyrinomonadaceae bacterium]
MTEIGESREPAAIIDLLSFTLASEFDVAATAALAIQKLLPANPVAELIRMESALSHGLTYSGQSYYDWYKLSPDQLGSFERFGDAAVSLFGVASIHHSGYVREAALRKLSPIRSGAELPFLILRLNDWVSNVRNVAYHAIQARLTPEYCRHFIANLPVISRLERAGRVDHTPIIHAINQLLQSDECRSALLGSLKSEDRHIRRAGFRLVLDVVHPGPEVLKLALADEDTVIRQLAAKTISSRPEMFGLFLGSMKHDRFMPVRREALRIAVATNSPDVVEQLQSGLLDSHASIREECRWHLQKIQATDFAAFYRQHLEGRDLYSAISGLGETGRADDSLLIAPHATHHTSKIRRAAIKALAALNPKAHLDLFMTALADEVPNVSRHALKALSRKTSLLSVAQVWDLFSSSSRVHVKRNALSLIQKFGKWESISYLLRALREPDPDLVTQTQRAIQHWLATFNRSFSQPTSEQVSSLKDALEKCGGLIGDETREQLRFAIKGL